LAALVKIGTNSINTVVGSVEPVEKNVDEIIPDILNLEIMPASRIQIGLEKIAFMLGPTPGGISDIGFWSQR
jgi:hypothetical protein